MKRMELDKGEMLVTRHVNLSEEGFIVSIVVHEDDTFGLHIKISTDTGDFYNIEFPLERLRRFKGII